MHSRRILLTTLLTFTALALPSLAHADITGGSGAEVEITSPKDGETLDITPFYVSVSVAEDLLDVASVELRVDGSTYATLTEGPWTFTEVQLDEGMHELVAVVIEVDAVETASEPVNIAVVEGGASEPSKGCAVTPAGGLGGLALAGLALAGLVGLRRRR